MRELTSDRGRAMALYRWTCACCGEAHDELPTCWGSPSPLDLLPEGERERSAIFNRDTGILDDNTFYVRGGIYIPIHGMDEPGHDARAFRLGRSLRRRRWKRRPFSSPPSRRREAAYES